MLDLGGSPGIWECVSVPLEITLLNLPGALSLGEFEILQTPRLRHHTLGFKVYFRFLPSVSAFFRRRRMRKFVGIFKINPGTKVLDLGGSPGIWECVSVPLEITLLNLPGALSL